MEMYKSHMKFKLDKTSIWNILIKMLKNKTGGYTMTRIKVDDLPEDHKIGRDEMKKVMGGAVLTSFEDPIIGGEALPVFGAGRLTQGITGVNFRTGSPIQYFPGSHW